MKVHIEDFAQVGGTPPQLRDVGADYGRIGALIRALAGDDSFREYLRRLVAMVLMGNTDAHLKNWSLIYRDGRTPLLSPAYDLVCATVYLALTRTLTFSLGGERHPSAIGPGQFQKVAEAAEYPAGPAMDVVGETTARLLEAWRAIRQAGVFPRLVDDIDRRLADHPLTR